MEMSLETEPERHNQGYLLHTVGSKARVNGGCGIHCYGGLNMDSMKDLVEDLLHKLDGRV